MARASLIRTQAFIGGRWLPSSLKRTFPVVNPSNQEVICEVADLNASDAEEAVKTAKKAFNPWSSFTAKDRAGVMLKWRDAILKNKEDLAKIITLEEGKPMAESVGEVSYGASFLEWFAEEGKRVYGDVVPPTAGDRRLLVLKQPAGVSVLIAPWNFPVAMILRKAGAALAAGCTAVVKPSEEAPLSALALASLAEEAGVPEGVFNVVPCSREQVGEVGEALVTSNDVAKVSFTGSTTAGKVLMRYAAEGVKKLSLELGGNAPLIVFNSADIKVAVASTMAAKFRNSGQTCVCPNRLFVQEGVYDEYLEELCKAVSSLKVGDGFTEGVQQGPLINQQGIDKVVRHVSDACSKGATVVVGGDVRSDVGKWFYQPTVLTGLKEDMTVSCEETFGPVAAITRFSSEEGLQENVLELTATISSENETKDTEKCMDDSEDKSPSNEDRESTEQAELSQSTIPLRLDYREWHGRLENHVFESKFVPIDHESLTYLCKGGPSEVADPSIDQFSLALDAAVQELGGHAFVRLNISAAEDAAISDFEKLSPEEKDHFHVQIINRVELEKQLASASAPTRRDTFARRLVSQSSQSEESTEQPKNLPRSALKPEAEEVDSFDTLGTSESPEAIVLRAFSQVSAERMQVTSGKDALRYLASSSNVKYRLNRLRGTDGGWDESVDVYAVVRQWLPALPQYPGMHLRGFVYDNSLNALSQINDSTFFPYLLQQKQYIQQRVEVFFKEVLCKTLEDVRHYVVNVFVSPKSVLVTDVLPFDKTTGACLFTWRENEQLFKSGPLEFRVCSVPTKDGFPSLPSQWENELLRIVAELKKLSQKPGKSGCTLL